MAKTFTTTFFLLAVTSVAPAQDWQKLNVPTSQALITPYFVNENFGFLFQDHGYFGGYASVYKTSDGGITWNPLQPFNGESGAVVELHFTSPSHGYLLFDTVLNADIPHQNMLSGIIYETNDTGNTWSRVTPSWMSVCSMYATHDPGGNYLFVTAVQLSSTTGNLSFGSFGSFPWPYQSTIFQSFNDGVTWDSVPPLITNGNAPIYLSAINGNRDQLVHLLASDAATNIFIIYSTNLGATWKWEQVETLCYPGALFGFSLFTFSPRYTCDIIRLVDCQSEDSEDVYSYYEGLPPYDLPSWNHLVTTEAGGWVDGSSCAQYVCNASDAPGADLGMIRFENFDTSHVGGPNVQEFDDLHSRNFCATGHGAVVYVGTREGEVWKTTDGGDGTLSVAGLAPQFVLTHTPFPSGTDTLLMNDCNQSELTLLIQNIGCSLARLDSVSIVGLIPTEYSYALSPNPPCQIMPRSTLLTLAPKTPGVRNVVIHFHLTDDEDNPVDTSIQFILNVQPGATPVPITLSFQSSSMNATPGDTISVPVYLSGTATLGGTSITLPFGVDTNILVPVGFEPAIAGMIVDASYYSGSTETISLSSANNFTLNGSTLIGYLRCVVYLTDTLTTAITLPTASLNSTTVPCVALSLTTDSIAINIVGCGTKTLQQFMLGNQFAFGILRIVPNPASNEITIVCAGTDASTHATFTISDPLGRNYTVPTTPYPLLEKEGEITLDISSLPPGVYFVSDGVSGAKFVKE